MFEKVLKQEKVDSQSKGNYENIWASFMFQPPNFTLNVMNI